MKQLQAITLRGMIIESLPLTIVMINGFVWKPGILIRSLVPGMTEFIYHKNIYILLVDDVTLTVYKVMSFNSQAGGGKNIFLLTISRGNLNLGLN